MGRSKSKQKRRRIQIRRQRNARKRKLNLKNRRSAGARKVTGAVKTPKREPEKKTQVEKAKIALQSHGTVDRCGEDRRYS